jgi:hypothetical protein
MNEYENNSFDKRSDSDNECKVKALQFPPRRYFNVSEGNFTPNSRPNNYQFKQHKHFSRFLLNGPFEPSPVREQT